ncbi:hypothetical protein FQZ97_1056490 [compost metagenome]
MRFPQRSQLIIERGQQIERRALRVGLQILHLHADADTVHAAHGPQDANAVAQVNQPQQREREILVSQQLHLQRERQDVGIRRRQQTVVGKPADVAISRQTFRIDIDPATQTRIGQRGAGDLASRRGLHIQPGQARFAVECVPIGNHR